MKYINADKNIHSPQDWQVLFELIPVIKKTLKFGEILLPDNDKNGAVPLPIIQQSSVVERFLDIIVEQNLSPTFNWTDWQEGKDYLKNPVTNYSDLEINTLRKLLTVIIRINRFNDGYLVNRFEVAISV
uniref:DUF6508 domain-containing protein n=1 Tax=uncultured Draconibacterium sp. TaxID=1573823 RepID=UPI00321643B9